MKSKVARGCRFSKSFVIGALLVGLVLVCTWIALPAERLLLPLSTPVLSPMSVSIPYSPMSDGGYSWLSNEEFVCIKHGRVFRRNIHSEVEIELAGPKDKQWSICSVRASSDGQWVLCTISAPPPKFSDLEMIDAFLINAKTGVGYERNFISDEQWTQDGKHTIGVDVPKEGVNSRNLVLFDPVKKRLTKIASLGPRTENSHLDSPWGVALWGVDTSFSDPKITEVTGKCAIDLRTYQRGKLLAVHRDWVINLPKDANANEWVVSPNGQFVAWNMTCIHENPLLARLHRHFPAIPSDRHTTEELWISTLDHKVMHEVGHIRVKPSDANGGDSFSIQGIQWLPDNRHLSYVYRDKLYVVPME